MSHTYLLDIPAGGRSQVLLAIPWSLPGGRARPGSARGKLAPGEGPGHIVITAKPQPDRSVDLAVPGEHLDRRLRWWESEGEIKPSTLASYREACEVYLRPGLGHLRLVDLRGEHFRDLYAAMRLINRSAAEGDTSDMLRRLLAARASRDGKRVSTRPLTAARIRRVAAVASSVLADLVPETLPANPAAGVKTGRHRRVKPLLWTPPRVSRWRQTGEVPGRVMVWTREQCGMFLDSIEGERLYALYHLAAYFGLRRSELCGLMWADADLVTRRVHVRQAQVDDVEDSTKSEDSERILIIDQGTADVLKAWHKAQVAEQLAWAGVWSDSGRCFTREDGTPLRPSWVSHRFDTLAARAGLPPILPHGLRHGSATMALAAGVPIKAISEMLRPQHLGFRCRRLYRGGGGTGRRRGLCHRRLRPTPRQDRYRWCHFCAIRRPR
jgi:integrase